MTKKKSAATTPKVKKIRANNDAPVATTPAEASPVEAPTTSTAAKRKREKAPKEDLMTFAFRMPKTESAALHKAAGPANASRVMRALAGAFVTGDRVVFEQIVEDARKLTA